MLRKNFSFGPSGEGGNLRLVGFYDQGGFVQGGKKYGDPLRTIKGYTYVIDKNPMQRASLSNNEIKYSRALFEATYGNEFMPENFISEGVSDFRNDVIQLRASLSFDYIKTVKDALANRVLSDDIFALDRAKDFRNIADFLAKWEGKTMS